MKTNPQQFTPEQSFQVINEMIFTARKNFTKISFFFLIWGWLLLAAGLTEFILINYYQSELAFVVWPVVGFAGGIFSAVYNSRSEKKAGAVSFMDKLFSYLWIAFIFTLILILAGSVTQNVSPHSFVMILTGLPTLVTGRILKFNPLIIGGIIFWITGIVSVFLFPQYGSLYFSATILAGYIIPGYLLMKQEKTNV